MAGVHADLGQEASGLEVREVALDGGAFAAERAVRFLLRSGQPVIRHVGMALAGKGTRIIVVGGERFRWVVAPDGEPGLAVIVERAIGHGQRMATWVEHGTIITPGLVAQIIRDALERGWTPRELGKQITFRVEAPTERQSTSPDDHPTREDFDQTASPFQDPQSFVDAWSGMPPNQIPDNLDNVGSGWHPLLLRLHEQLLATSSGYRVDRLKEKYGTLRLYISGRFISAEAKRLVRAAEEESSRICEYCGNPARETGHAWTKTLCDNCAGPRPDTGRVGH